MPGWVDTAVEDYRRRLRSPWRLALIELPPAHHGEGEAAAARARSHEARSLCAQLSARDFVVALDERGSEPTTRELARWLQQRQDSGQDLAFLMGGADGLDETVLQRAQYRWSLSRLTMAHALARVVMVEQLYRAVSVLAGHPYHRD